MIDRCRPFNEFMVRSTRLDHHDVGWGPIIGHYQHVKQTTLFMGGLLNILVQFVGPNEFLELLAMIVSGLFEVDIGISYDMTHIASNRGAQRSSA